MSEEDWIEKYRDSTRLVENSVGILTGFNANIDVIHQLSDIEIDLSNVDPELSEHISTIEELKSSLKYCIENAENNEIDIGDLEPEFEGEENIGGQGGIMSNFLAGTGNGVIFYTPLLSEELSSKIDEKVLYPVIDGEFMLKNVQDASNTDRTKKNHIFEFNDDSTGRLIVSDTLKGFGPYFRKGVEENLDTIQQNIDCAVFSGFQDIEGNKDAKLKKSAKQLGMINKPVHLEFVNKNRKITSLILKYILPEVESFGIDETEFVSLMDILDIEQPEGDLNLGEAFDASKEIIRKFGIERIHLHTYRYHLTVASDNYPTPISKIRDSMLYGEVAAIQEADTGSIPDKEDINDFDMQNKEINGLNELNNFGNFFDIKEFEKSGTAEIDGFKVAAIPTIIHNDPERTVGMGDIISSGAFSSEFS
jgi:ADP-dependent phosphofructokinase/glucokinase